MFTLLNNAGRILNRNNHLQLVIVTLSGLLFGVITGNDLAPSGILYHSFFIIASGIGITIFWILFSRLTARALAIDSYLAKRRSFLSFAAIALLPLFYLPFLLYRGGRITGLGDDLTLSFFWQTMFVAVLSCALVFSLLARQFPYLRKGPINAAADHPAITLSIMMAVWLAAACFMDITKTHFLQVSGANTPQFVDMLRNINSDKGVLHSELLQANGSSILGLHSTFIWFLVYPIFSIWPGYEWFLTITNVALVMAAVPIYLLSRRYFGAGTSLIIVAIFLLNRTILSQPGAADSSEERFLPVLLISAFYFLHARRLIPFVIFSILTMAVREDAAIVIALLGLYALLTRYGYKWSLPPIIAGTFWFLLSMTWLIPTMNPANVATKALVHYGDLGSSSGELVKTLLFKPWVVFQKMISTAQHLATIYGLAISFGFGVFLFSGSFIIALPAVVETLLVNHPNLSHFNSIAITAAIFPSFILGLANADRLTRVKFKSSLAISLALITMFTTASLTYTWFTPNRYQPRYNYDTIKEIMASLPDDAKVIMPIFMINESKPDQDVRGYYQVPYEVDQQGGITLEQDYVIIDTRNVPESWQDSREFKGSQEVLNAMEASGAFSLVLEKDDLAFYVRKSAIS